ncbi:MAG: hypothetical protein ABSA67_18355 [Candidatus Brocadiia bacterium]|jgi:hypothetical protein
MKRISAIEALQRLKAGSAVINAEVLEPIDLLALCPPHPQLKPDSIPQRIEFRACRLNSLDAITAFFQERLTLIDTRVEAQHGSFWCCYFLKGAQIERCEFISQVDFSCGEGNKDGSIFALKDTVFHEFVDFTDYIFDGPVEIHGCRFEKGTNLLGNRGQPHVVRFRVPPILEANEGRMDIDGYRPGLKGV